MHTHSWVARAAVVLYATVISQVQPTFAAPLYQACSVTDNKMCAHVDNADITFFIGNRTESYGFGKGYYQVGDILSPRGRKEGGQVAVCTGTPACVPAL